ncbi:hypothetical protein CASFOL_032314 [Castilleja foliolosa]|uniref:Uncharacterized protein n=1 Tax=Castilleja foliolosa TaxID=1961234 RepID=A0ABD3C140_9LAMI
MGAPDMDDLNFADSELDCHVRNAINDAVQGNSDFYNQLVSVIHHNERLGADEAALLVTCLKAVTKTVSSINIVHHGSLLAAVNIWNESVELRN